MTGSVGKWIFGQSAPADGLQVAELSYRHCYLAPTGDYELHATYVVENRGEHETGHLLPDSTSFFVPQDLGLAGVVTLDYDTPSGCRHRVHGSPHFEAPEWAPMPDGKPARTVTTVRWHPRAVPPIPARGTLTYTCIIRARSTEIDAFSVDGSYAGGAARWSTRRIALQCEAPEGYKFDESSVVKMCSTDSNAAVEIDGLPAPRLNDTASVLTWTLEGGAVRVNVHYNLALRIVPRGDGVR